MSPDKLFDYLDGRLPARERADLEDRLLSDKQLQRELAVARRIHASLRGDSREVVLEETENAERSRKLALRIGLIFIVLTAVNVGAGLWLIARHESKNPNRALLEKQTRDQIKKSLESAAAAKTPWPESGLTGITLAAATGRLNARAEEVVAAAQRLDGSATKGLPDEHRMTVLVDLPSDRETEFRATLAAITGGAPATPSPAETSGPGSEKKSFVVQIVELTPATQK
jgi:anti-sigma factor RsiW